MDAVVVVSIVAGSSWGRVQCDSFMFDMFWKSSLARRKMKSSETDDVISCDVPLFLFCQRELSGMVSVSEIAIS